MATSTPDPASLARAAIRRHHPRQEPSACVITNNERETDVDRFLKRWCCAGHGGLALRCRSVGGGSKPPQAAAVKSRGGERCWKRPAVEWVRCRSGRRSEENH